MDSGVQACLPIDIPYKSVRRQEAHRARQQAVDGARQQAVAEEQHARYEALNVQFGPVEPDAVHEDPGRGAGPDEDGLPPPMVVLRAQLYIRRHDRDLDDGNDADEGDDGEETEDVVVPAFILPDAAEDEEQLDEDDGEGDQAREQDAVDASGVPWLLWYLASDAVCLGWVFVRVAAVVTVPATAVDEGKLDEKPEGDETDQCAEWECGAGSLRPDKEVEDEDCREEKAGKEEGCHKGVSAPVLSIKRLIDPSGEIAGEHPGEDEETHANADETAAKAGVENAKGAEDEKAGGHEDELGA